MEKFEEVAEEIRSLGVKCLPLRCDVSDSKAVAEAALAVEKDFANTDSFLAFIKRSIPFRRICKAEDIQSATVFLATQEFRYVTGAIITVDGGVSTVR